MSTAEPLTSLFRFLYGDLIGQIVVGPLLLVAAWGLPARRHSFWRDLGAFTVVALAMLLLARVQDGLADYVLMLAFAPLFYLGFRQGWEGAAIGVAMLGVMVQAMAQAQLLGVSVTVMQLQLAVIGSGALVLGAATTALRLSHDALALRHRRVLLDPAHLAERHRKVADLQHHQTVEHVQRRRTRDRQIDIRRQRIVEVRQQPGPFGRRERRPVQLRRIVGRIGVAVAHGVEQNPDVPGVERQHILKPDQRGRSVADVQRQIRHRTALHRGELQRRRRGLTFGGAVVRAHPRHS